MDREHRTWQSQNPPQPHTHLLPAFTTSSAWCARWAACSSTSALGWELG